MPLNLLPPVCNTGGANSNLPSHSTKKTLIDTISFTFVLGLKDASPIIRRHFPDSSWSEPSRGQHGYKQQKTLLAGSKILGWLSYGAAHGRHWLYITGDGLRYLRSKNVQDDELVTLARALDSGEHLCRLTRVDIAFDIFDGTYTVEDSVQAHQNGRYTLEKARVAPLTRLYQSDTAEPLIKARTQYIGSLRATKAARIYDKGLQLLASMQAGELYAQSIIKSDGPTGDDKLEDWVRFELIYKYDKDRPIDMSLVLNRDDVFAGAYPYFAEVLANNTGTRPAYAVDDSEFAIARLVKACRDSYGGLIYFLKEKGLSDSEIVALTIGDKRAARIKSSLETVTFDDIVKELTDDIPMDI